MRAGRARREGRRGVGAGAPLGISRRGRRLDMGRRVGLAAFRWSVRRFGLLAKLLVVAGCGPRVRWWPAACRWVAVVHDGKLTTSVSGGSGCLARG